MGKAGIAVLSREGVDALADLLGAIANEDCAAFRLFRRATLSKVMKTALGILRDYHAAEDVTQEVFLIVWNRAGSFARGAGSVISWLSTITRNRCFDYLRSLGTGSPHDTLDAVSDLPDSAPTPYDLVELKSRMMVVRERLDRLPVAEKDLLISAIVNEIPNLTLARALNMPLPTLKSKVRRALHKLSQDPDERVVAIC